MSAESDGSVGRLRVVLDNAQTGGPQVRIEADGATVGKLYPRSEDTSMEYWDFGSAEGWNTLEEMPEVDGIVLYDSHVDG